MLTKEQREILPKQFRGAGSLCDITYLSPTQEWMTALMTSYANSLLELKAAREVLHRKCGQMVDSGGQNPDGSWIEIWKPCELVAELDAALVKNLAERH